MHLFAPNPYYVGVYDAMGSTSGCAQDAIFGVEMTAKYRWMIDVKRFQLIVDGTFIFYEFFHTIQTP